MFPQTALAGTDRLMVAPGTPDPAAGRGVALPPPNPALGDAMRNRNWGGHERQMYYEMQQAPLPHQYSRDAAHPRFGGGSGTPLTQFLPQGQPTGFAARQAPVAYGAAGVAPGMIRPTYAYNRVAGAQGRQPTMYAGTWPNQGYPHGSNTYIPSWEATGILIKYTRDPSNFRINKYVKDIKVSKDQGYYLTLGADDPYRVVSVNDYIWDDEADAPGGRQEKQAFGFQPYRTARYCFPFNLGRKSVQQAEWPILANHAQMAACKAMTVRTIILTALATNQAYWSGAGYSNTGTPVGPWSTSTMGTQDYIQKTFNNALIQVEQASGGIVTDEEALQVTMNPILARQISVSPEYKQFIQGSPDALAAITDQRNPNRKYGLAPFLYGLGLVVENAVVVTTPKAGALAPQSRNYIWPTGLVCITSKPQGIVQAEDSSLDFSTFAMRFFEQMTTESKSDPDNRREVGRVVEDYSCTLQAPQTGFLITGVS